MPLPTWAQTKTGAKKGFDSVYRTVDKLGPHVNRFSNKIGSEAFWPTTLDKESEKAARILKSFCKDGFYVEETREVSNGAPKGKQRVIKKIPTSVIQNAQGLCIFTVMRTGLWFSGAGGAGVLVGRMPNGEWSPPSGVMLHTAGLGFLAGIDIYDCVVVINTQKALEAFTKIRCTLGGEVSAVAGPVGMGGVLESEVHKRQAPVFNYLKSRGLYAGVQVDGTIIIERTDENERFYGERIPVADILAGKARHPPPEINILIQTIKSAQGDTDVDESVLPSSEPTPGDFEISDDQAAGFGIPKQDDPDPFGVHALEESGMEIREAGTGARPSLDAFEYHPSPTSPVWGSSMKQAMANDPNYRRSFPGSPRRSVQSDRGTQTDDDDWRHRRVVSEEFVLDNDAKQGGMAMALAEGQNTPRSELENPILKPKARGPPPPLPPREPILLEEKEVKEEKEEEKEGKQEKEEKEEMEDQKKKEDVVELAKVHKPIMEVGETWQTVELEGQSHGKTNVLQGV